jgi:hypothetical protein
MYSFLTSALDGGERSAPSLGSALSPGKDPPVPPVQEPGWAPEPVWTQRIEGKSFAPAEDRTCRTVPSQTLYLLSYPADVISITTQN